MSGSSDSSKLQEIDSICITTRQDRHTETILFEQNCSISFRISRRAKAYLPSSALVYIGAWKVRDSVFRRSFQVFYPCMFILLTSVILSSSVVPSLIFLRGGVVLCPYAALRKWLCLVLTLIHQNLNSPTCTNFLT